MCTLKGRRQIDFGSEQIDFVVRVTSVRLSAEIRGAELDNYAADLTTSKSGNAINYLFVLIATSSGTIH